MTYFLELDFVEVSSDGVNYFRFPATSYTDTTVQTGSFGSTDATKINKIIKDSGANASKFLGLSAEDKKTAQEILDKKESATDVERIKLKSLVKKSGLEEDGFETKLKDLDKVKNLYGNASPEEKEKISKEAKALKLLKDDKQGKIDEFEKHTRKVL